MTDKQAKRVRPRDRGEVYTLFVEISPALAGALEVGRKCQRRTKRAFVEMALEKALIEAGHWPPVLQSSIVEEQA